MSRTDFDVSLPVDGRPVTVFGAGSDALGVIATLRDARADLTVVAPEAVAAVSDLSDRQILTWHARAYEPADLDGPWLVISATGDPDLDDRITRDAEDRRLWCIGRTRHAPAEPAGHGTVVLVGGGPGDPGLLTIAGRRALREADVVICDRLAPLAALSDLRPGAEVVDVAKVPRGRFTAQEEINRLLVEHAAAGKRVVRLKGGDNFIFGRGGEELEACAAAGVPVEVIPGVSSAVAGPALAGIPVTHRGLNQGFTVVSGHVPPGDPRSTIDYAALARSGTDLVLLMAVATLPEITRTLVAGGLDPRTPAVMIADATMTTQRIVRADVTTIAAAAEEAGLRSPAITVIGRVAGFDPRVPAD